MKPATIEIVPLTPARQQDYLRFFDQDAFADNPRWAACYCWFPHADHSASACPAWEQRTAHQNREAAARCISGGTLTGFLALADGKAVGWCNANRITRYSVVNPEPGLDADEAGFIACFVVAAPWRGHGIARRLLDAACDHFRAQGCRWVEARPAREANSAADNYHGPLALYLSRGFQILREEGNTVVVRRRLI